MPAYYQMAGSDRVEKRLCILTIVSAIPLPLGLIAGLLGMNVGVLPGDDPLGPLRAEESPAHEHR